MASSRSTNTMQEFLQRMIQDISMAKTLPDADLQFLIGLETGILQKLREPVDALQGQMQGMGAGGGAQGAPAGPPPMSSGAPPGMADGIAAAMGGPGTGGMGGPPMDPGMGAAPPMMPGAEMTSPDEMRRMLGQ